MKLIVAVSGGVDSVVMLHQLVQQGEAERGLVSGGLSSDNYSQHPNLIIAHVDHGLREDSAADARFVAGLAQMYDLPFEATRLELSDGSEAAARAGRWEFLRSVKAACDADAIATAHHQDDVIETMLINLLRGTNRKGLTSLRQRPGVVRPLLGLAKTEIYDYALAEGLEWVEDSTNLSDKYLRNRLRRYVTSQLSGSQRQQLLDIYNNLTQINQQLDQELSLAADTLAVGDKSPFRIETNSITQLPRQLQLELFAYWWQQLLGSPPPDSLQLERMVDAAEQSKTGNVYQLANQVRLQVSRGYIELFVDEN